jgi:acyl-CoA dehydrogenase
MKPYRSPWMDDELALYRDTVGRFVEAEMLPHDAEWRKQKNVGHDIWRAVGAQGFLLPDVPVDYGGAGGDFRHETIFHEELARRGISGFGLGVHSICAHYVLNHGNEEQKQRWLPRMARGELVGAIAMTEPGAGSDLKGIRTRAELDGDHYVVNGSKIFITNGSLAEILMLVVRTDFTVTRGGLSLLMVETRDLAGFRVSRVLDKMGLHAQDTAELFFENMRVHRSCLLGKEGQGMHQMMADLPYERMMVAIAGVAAMEGGLEATIAYVRERKAFGQTIGSMQTECSPTTALRARPRARSIPKPPRWPSTGSPTISSRCWTTACSCMAATGT